MYRLHRDGFELHGDLVAVEAQPKGSVFAAPTVTYVEPEKALQVARSLSLDYDQWMEVTIAVGRNLVFVVDGVARPVVRDDWTAEERGIYRRLGLT